MTTLDRVPLGEHATFLSGFAFDSARFNTEGRGLPLVRIRDVMAGRSETFYDGEFDPRFEVANGDYLIGMDGEFNVAPWSGGRAVLNQRVTKITGVSRRLDLDYLFRFLSLELKRIEAATPSVTVKHLSIKTLRQIILPLPPLAEQRRIAQVLDATDDLRRARVRSIQQAECLPSAMYRDMFGDGRPFEVVSLGEVTDIVSGITKGRRINSQALTEVPYLAVVNVQDGRLEMSPIKTIAATEQEIDRYRLITDDLLLTEGGDPDKLGRGALWSGELPTCIHQNHVFRVRVHDPRDLNPAFLRAQVASPRARNYFLRAAKQTTGIASINMTQLRALPIDVPPINLQRSFEKRVRGAACAIDNRKRHLWHLDSLFASLQHRAFNGGL